jgi:hypothetical protein
MDAPADPDRWATAPRQEVSLDMAGCAAACPPGKPCAAECTRAVEAGYRGLPRYVPFSAGALPPAFKAWENFATCNAEEFGPYVQRGPSIQDLQLLTNQVSR